MKSFWLGSNPGQKKLEKFLKNLLTNRLEYAIIIPETGKRNPPNRRMEIKMEAIKLTWIEIDWDTYYAVGYNYTKRTGVIYAINEEIARKKCPISEKEGKIKIEKIIIEEN